jgi:hypothetical protein
MYDHLFTFLCSCDWLLTEVLGEHIINLIPMAFARNKPLLRHFYINMKVND